MYLSLRRFGPLEEAEIEVNRITLFIGPNGSGKSYTAMALYAILRALARGRGELIASCAASWSDLPGRKTPNCRRV
jgi:Uncharacterized conserved protein